MGKEPKESEPVSAAFRAHERLLWGLCYRMTGSAADADDLVQETFARALASPPPDMAAPLRPWLVRVAMNLARDQLRRRRRTHYDGPWLPEPIDTDGDAGDLPLAHEPAHTEARYDLLESVTLAFLVALEALSPPQRAVLLLRDVFDYSVAETAAALALSQANVKTTHHRARRAMTGYEASRAAPSGELADRTRAALEGFLSAVLMGDVAAVERFLADDVRSLSDGGGEYLAARVPIVGPARVAKACVRLTAKLAGEAGEHRFRRELRSINGLPALVVENDDPPRRWAPRWIFQIQIGPDGLIKAVHSVLGGPKMAAIRPIAASMPPG